MPREDGAEIRRLHRAEGLPILPGAPMWFPRVAWRHPQKAFEMPEKRKEDDQVFSEGAVRIAHETCKPIAAIAREFWGKTRGALGTG